MTRTTFSPDRDTLRIEVSRVFDAPRDLVWRTITDPALAPEWWGPSYLTTTVEKMEFRPGGAWRFVQRDREGNVHAFHGVYREIDPPVRVVNTFNYEPIGPGHEMVETLVLEELPGGKTRVTNSSQFASLADFDGMVQSGAESGAVESYERLAALLARVGARLPR